MEYNDNKISNVIGTHIPIWLLEQLQTRSKKGVQTTRDNENLQYLANKTGWVRLVSSINVNSSNDITYFQNLTGITLNKPDDLAKNFVLYGGVSKYNNQNGKATYTLRKGFKETYSLLGEQEIKDFGYRPMPGLTRVVVETQGKLGSVRSATVEFKVWDKSQLDVIDTLYFKLGYMMFLEWGNTFYYESESSQLKSSELFSFDPFKDSITKESIASHLGKSRRDSKGNYDGMLGMVSNFSFSYNQEGGYDCVLKMVGLGSIADGMKINQSATISKQSKSQIEYLQNLYKDIQKQQDAKLKAEQASIAASKIAAEEKAAQEKLEADKAGKVSIFQSILRKQQVEKGLEESSFQGDGTPALIEDSFFRNHAVPSSKIVSNKKTLDYDKRQEYDYIYENLLYLTKPGIVLQGNIGSPQDISSVVQKLNLDSNYISTVVLKGQSINSIVQSGLTGNLSQFSQNVQYYSTTNRVNNSSYQKGYPYNFRINLTFTEENASGVNVTYKNNKSTIASEFLKQILNQKSQTSIKINSYSLRISDNTRFTIFIKGDFLWGLNLTTKDKKFNNATGQIEETVAEDKDTLKLPFTIEIEDSGLISDIVLAAKTAQTTQYVDYRAQQEKIAKQNTGTTPAENTNPTSNTSTDQTKPAIQYQSSLEATLRSIQIYSLVQAITASSKKIDLDRKVREVNLTDPDFAKPVFSDGIFVDYIDKIISGELSDRDVYERNLKYGFNAALLSNKGTNPPEVNYSQLFKSYVLPYEINQNTNEGSQLAHPVYIQLGLLMFILNHSCNLYDKKTNETNKATPLVYIDYNPQTNFCLSHPCHMTTNAMTFMIPFEGTFNDYKKLFYTNILEGDNILGTEENKNQKTPLFNPEKDDTISGDLPRFKGLESIDAYRGRIMNVLVNIDYIFDIIKQFFSQDETNSVFLKAFLEQILSDMNKTLGNFNIFRLSYDDASNCLQIIDDQLVPGIEGEDIVPKDSKYDIPIYGKNSIARSLDLRTDISSKIANTLAISANAEIQKKSASSIDGTPFGFINQNYEDRFIKSRVENSNITREKDALTLKNENAYQFSAIISSALKFNKNVKDFYSTYNPSTDNVGHALNYFIEKLSKNKLDPPTRAAAMIPVSINFTLDGISGFNMMQGFTISERFLPYTYNIRKISEKAGIDDRKVGFMVTGNVHTIENNQWTTAIKANMTYLKERAEFNGSLNTSLRKGAQASFNPESNNPDKSQLGFGNASNYPTVSGGYVNVSFSNIGLGNPAADRINPRLLLDISKAAVAANVRVEVPTAVSGHTSSPSRHNAGNAVDIARIDGVAVSKDAKIKPTVDKFVQQLIALGYTKNAEGSTNPKSVLTFGFENHDDHVHISNLQS